MILPVFAPAAGRLPGRQPERVRILPGPSLCVVSATSHNFLQPISWYAIIVREEEALSWVRAHVMYLPYNSTLFF